MSIEVVTQRETVFSRLDPRQTDAKRTGATMLQEGAASVLGREFAAELRRVISPRLVIDKIDDPMIRFYGSALVTTGKALGLDAGPRLSYIAASLLARLGKRQEEAQPLLDAFSAAYLQPEETAIAKQVSFLLDMKADARDRFLIPLSKMTVPEKRDPERTKPDRSVQRAWDAWEKLAEYVDEKESPTSVVPIQRQRRTPFSQGGSGRA